ncbi:bifunctional 2-polyprenyl-6-hydroxyphenol methylase/3-demethylubiquinol 3-O-methyltransferase UbiG [Synechococcus sp. UW179B]|uniref:class I SAM-dependent methyltransferase n=1 Tax=Synechococcus sp. UW179B TaxID=2575516 RepID=UPI000E0EF9F0|nr:methyltransferase domain-containing protein [Synechococcus sp. UW179B]
MKQETQDFLNFIDRELNPGIITIERWKEYLNRLPQIYNNDIAFRLLFDWHWTASLNSGRSWHKNLSICTEDPIYSKQVALINGAGAYYHKLNYQYRELILFHARTDLRGKSLLEIGGSLPNDLLFEHLGIDSYINIESPDYIEAESGKSYTDKHGDHERRKTIYCNAEDIHTKVKPESIDTIFSVACFEHIYDLPAALEACHACSKRGGTLYSYFAPIYSQIQQGDHGVIPQHEKFPEKPIGLHLLSSEDQRKKLINAGITDPKEIQDFLGRVNFDRVPNRLLYEDYERICTESPYGVLELDRQDCFNLSKLYANEFKEVRGSNPKAQNMMTIGFRVHLLKN